MALVNKIKTLSSVGILAATLFLAGCQAQSNILAFTPPVPSASMNVNRTAVVSVTTKDSRTIQEIASYTKHGELIKLNASQVLHNYFSK